MVDRTGRQSTGSELDRMGRSPTGWSTTDETEVNRRTEFNRTRLVRLVKARPVGSSRTDGRTDRLSDDEVDGGRRGPVHDIAARDGDAASVEARATADGRACRDDDEPPIRTLIGRVDE